MIVKFHPRGRGGGAGPVDYLLGKDRQRDGATVLQGKPEEVRELIDASPYAKVHIRRPVLCRKGFTARAARKADGEL
ncbi:hypothetical protein [Escherichia coli]|uniref:hypothetical protein n=1 Tax=Escherichia coli TaxID=562 RepID=UPI003890CA14